MTNDIGRISYQKLLSVSIPVLLAICIISIPAIYAEDLPPVEITEKDDRKMDSRLAALYDDVSTRSAPNVLSHALTLSQDDQRVQVILIMNDVESQVPQDLGIVVETTYENMVQANIPITNLEAVSLDPNVLFIQTPVRPVPITEPNPMTHEGGHVLREGTAKMMADRLHAAGYTGKGIKVAVIDTGFDITNPEISGNIVESRSFRTDGNIRGYQGNEHEHGTASAEVVVDVAPDVQLYLYNLDTNLKFNEMVNHIITKNVDIITMSMAWPAFRTADGASDMSLKANQARDNGILWFNSAGNYAQSHWEGRFYDPDNDGWHNFQDGDETINISVPSYLVNEPMWVKLSWWGSPSQDFDLHLDRGDVEVAVGNNQQPRTIPYEDIDYTPQDMTTLHVSISKYAATENAYFQLFSNFDFDEYRVKNHSVTVPADATDVVAVGAYHWMDDRLASYSSQGPTIDGRIKPDLSAPSCATTSATSGYYCGTSGASPHAAGAAALIMQKYPDATADQVQKLMESTVKSRHAKSNQDGTGRVDLGMFVNSDILALDNSNSACASDNSCFFPKTLRVSKGDTVTWTNADNSPITITGNSGNSNFNSGQIFRGGSYPQTFTTDGTFSYSDGLHSWATGQIIVGSGVASSPPTFSSATYNQSSGVLTITFSKTIDKQQLNLSGLDIRESGYSSGGVDLTDARLQSTVNSATLTLTLTNADRTAVNSMTRPQLDISAGAVRDLRGNMIAAIYDRPITITGSSDTTPPTFVSATYNKNNGVLTTTFSELISKNNLNLSNLDIRESGQFSGGADLADAIMQTTTNTSTLTLTLTASDRNLVNVMRAPQLDITAGAVRDIAGNSILTTSDRPITVTGSSGNDGDLRSMIAELRSMINTINSKLASLEYSVSSLTARVTALESGSGTPPPPPPPTTGVKGKIYTDTNNNNRLDPGERGRAGIEVITVNLTNHSDVQRMRTDANGDYSFERNAGGYLLQAIGGGPNSYAYITIPNNTMLVQNLAY